MTAMMIPTVHRIASLARKPTINKMMPKMIMDVPYAQASTVGPSRHRKIYLTGRDPTLKETRTPGVGLPASLMPLPVVALPVVALTDTRQLALSRLATPRHGGSAPATGAGALRSARGPGGGRGRSDATVSPWRLARPSNAPAAQRPPSARSAQPRSG